EGIVRHPDGTFWTVDEYRPAIYHFEADGSLIERYVPEGTSLLGDTPQAVGYYGAETLPAEYAKRWSNRGFEAVALDPEKNVVYAFIQSPLHNPDSSTQNKSDVIRILGIDATDGTPVEEYIYLLERNANSGYSFARTDKIGDAVFAGNGKFFVLERDSSTPAQPTIGHKYIFEIDISLATNLLGDGAPTPIEGKTWEQHSAEDIAAQGVRPVWKRKVTNLPTLGYLPSDKAEGLALMEDGSFAIANDNDFTQAGFPDLTLGIIHFGKNNALDASNRDDSINITNWPTLGMYQPDTIGSYRFGEDIFLVTANEGDARDYEGFSEEERVGGLTLDENQFPDAEALQQDENLGRLNSTTATGDLDGDGDHDRIFSYGARSFSIWDRYGNLVFDSGDDLELITALYDPDNFNSNNDENDSFDSRSDDKGPEPEGLTLGSFNGRTYLFLGLERIGGVMIYDITNPFAPDFIDYFNNRNFDGDAEAFTAGDLGPEGLKFVSAMDSPTRRPMLIVGNEVSGTTTFFDLGTILIPESDGFDLSAATSDTATFSLLDQIGEGESIVIERFDEATGRWVKIATVTADNPVFQDSGLKPDSSYKYRTFKVVGGIYSQVGDEITVSTQDFDGF
ncbi:MAG: choice-of-anchor I family protein, partial [Verrucomicrobiae bacterium]|nr:choice-of-anchor I family protein [Verrucomicrobiae bacterium]